MNNYKPFLDWIASEEKRMEFRVAQWAAVNSGSYNISGLEQMARLLVEAFSAFDSPIQRLSLAPEKKISSDAELVEIPLGQALHLVQRPDAKKRVFLCIHMDTVYSSDHPIEPV